MVVKTSDIRGAGTDANVTLAMFGKLDGQPTSNGTHKLDNSGKASKQHGAGRRNDRMHCYGRAELPGGDM